MSKRRGRAAAALRWIVRAMLGVVLLAGALYGLAHVSTGRSGLARAIVWMDADVNDYERFPARAIDPDDPVEVAVAATERPPALPARLGDDLDGFLRRTSTAAFLAFVDDELVYERYFNGYERDSTVTSFSVAKSYISALIGITLDRGEIDDIDQPITDYVPELAERDERFERITLEHLLTMSSGLRYEEQGLPWSDDAQTYYGTDLRKLAIENTEIVEAPGERFHYNPYNTILLGLVLERATDQDVTTLTEEWLWDPAGLGPGGSWSLDSTDGFEKMESGLNGRAVDLAQLGLIYLHNGEWNDRRVVPRDWVEESTRVATAPGDPSSSYQYQWWTYTDAQLGDWYLARGNKGQFIAVFPRLELVLARFGTDFGYEQWPGLFADLARTYV